MGRTSISKEKLSIGVLLKVKNDCDLITLKNSSYKEIRISSIIGDNFSLRMTNSEDVVRTETLCSYQYINNYFELVNEKVHILSKFLNLFLMTISCNYYIIIYYITIIMFTINNNLILI